MCCHVWPHRRFVDCFHKKRERVVKKRPWVLDLQFIVGAIFASVAAITGVFVVIECFQAWQSASWPDVPGRVVSSQVVFRGGRRGAKTRIPEVTYEFTVDGRRRTGHRMFFGDSNSLAWPSGVYEFVVEHPAGMDLRVHYDPQHPARSVVSPGVTWQVLLGPALSLLFLGIGAYLIQNSSVLRRQWRQKHLAPDVPL